MKVISVCIQPQNVSPSHISQWSEASILVRLTLSRIPEMPEAPVSTELAAPLCPQPSMASFAAAVPPPFIS